MKAIKKGLLASVLVGCLLILVVTPAFSGEWKVPEKWKFIKFAGGSAAGSWTTTSAKICELINKQIPGITASSTTGASGSNLRAVNEGEMQLAFTTVDVLANWYYGLRGRKGKKMPKDIRFLGSMHYALAYIFTPKSSDIKDPSEIAKKPLRIAVGPAGSTVRMFNNTLLKIYGTSIKDLEARGGTANKVYYGAACKMMKDGQIDYLSFSTAPNASFIMDVATRPGIRFLEIGARERAILLDELPGTTEAVMPKGMYLGVEKDYNTIGTYFSLVVHKDMPEELAYRLSKVIWDNLKDIQSVGAFGKDIKLETAFKGMTIPMHPGAARYYKGRGMNPPEPKEPKM